MTTYKGKGVYGAIAIGKIKLFRKADVSVRKEMITDIDAEKKRVLSARKNAIMQLDEIYKKAESEVLEDGVSIIKAHMMLLEDEGYNSAIYDIIESQQVNAEHAVAQVAENYADMFARMEDAYMQERAADIRDISNRLIACLNGHSINLSTGDGKVILCADDLTPSETVTLDREKVLAFATANGSLNSHTAILARNMNIPAIIDLGDAWLSHLSDGMVAIVDGQSGEMIIDPDDTTLEDYQKKKDTKEEERRLLLNLKGKETVTLDGKKINIFANISDADDLDTVISNDAEGIGLFRSEYLYLKNDDFPTEEQQFMTYKKVLECMEGKTVIIRTLDIGADKQAPYMGLKKEANPALGLRAIRICLTRPDIFKTQLRALYRASVYGSLGIMFPMITSVIELERVMALCDEVKADLKAEGIQYSDSVQIGIMIETPAAAIISDLLAPMVDFFSVGTNDLMQYTLACDRQNPDIEGFVDTHHEAVLRLIELSAKNAHANGVWIGICGELAADTLLTERFLRMGIDELSVSPELVLEVRKTVRGLKVI